MTKGARNKKKEKTRINLWYWIKIGGFVVYTHGLKNLSTEIQM